MDRKIYQTALPMKRLSAGMLLFDEQGQLLVVEPTYKDTWEIPGGVVEDNESPRQAAMRELEEELGLQCVPLRLLGVDYTGENNNRTESLHFIFLGPVLTAEDIASIKETFEEKDFKATYNGKTAVMIEVYRVGGLHFVLDGHHRVSVACHLGHPVIDAYVTEVQTRVKPGDHVALEQLDALLVALDHLHVDLEGVAGVELGKVLAKTILGEEEALLAGEQRERAPDALGLDRRREDRHADEGQEDRWHRPGEDPQGGPAPAPEGAERQDQTFGQELSNDLGSIGAERGDHDRELATCDQDGAGAQPTLRGGSLAGCGRSETRALGFQRAIRHAGGGPGGGHDIDGEDSGLIQPGAILSGQLLVGVHDIFYNRDGLGHRYWVIWRLVCPSSIYKAHQDPPM